MTGGVGKLWSRAINRRWACAGVTLGLNLQSRVLHVFPTMLVGELNLHNSLKRCMFD